jgi:hypothetical protein
MKGESVFRYFIGAFSLMQLVASSQPASDVSFSKSQMGDLVQRNFYIPADIIELEVHCCVENIKAVEGSPSVEGVGEDAEGGFVMEGEVGSGAERAAGGAFEAAGVSHS